MSLIQRPRRNRANHSIRSLVRETTVTVDDLILPLFLLEGKNKKTAVESMPGVFRWTVDLMLKEIEQCLKLGITAFDVFPVVEERHKDKTASKSYDSTFFYLKALKEFPEDKNVIVVSDLIDWCKRQEWLQGDRFHFSDSSYETFGDGASVPYVDLCLMSLCGGAIIANSSLSWWGAWLQNDTGKVIAPEPWFGSANAHLDTKDMIPDRWIKIYNDPTPIPPVS